MAKAKKNESNNEKVLNMSLHETYVYQEKIDKQNISYIEEQFGLGVITKEAREYLVDKYSNTMEKYNVMYSSLLKVHGKSQGVKSYDLKTDKRERLYHENGEFIKESNRLITPFTSIEMDFLNSHDNYTYVQLPGIKDIRRAVEKVKIGGKYDKTYKKDVEKLRVKYLKKHAKEVEQKFVEAAVESRDFFEKTAHLFAESPRKKDYLKNISTIVENFDDKDIKEKIQSGIEGVLLNDKDYLKELKEIKEPQERLADVFRCSKSEVCFEDIYTTEENIKKSGIKILSIDNKHANNSPIDGIYKKDTYKGYRDYKLICEAEKDGVKVVFEMQIKLLPYAKRDKETHAIYQQIRVLEDQLDGADAFEKRRIAAEIFEKKMQIEAIYEECILENNARIIDMASRMEVRSLREKWKNKMMERVYNSSQIHKLSIEREKERDYLDAYKNQIIKSKEGVWGKISDGLVGSYVNEDGKTVSNYKDKEVAGFLRKNIIVSPKKPLNFNEVFSEVVLLSEKRKAEKSRANIKLKGVKPVKDDFRVSRGHKGIRSFIVRYHNEIRAPYIPEIRELTKEEWGQYGEEMTKHRQEIATREAIFMPDVDKGEIFSISDVENNEKRSNIATGKFISLKVGRSD